MVRPLVLVGGVIALLLLGGAVGMRFGLTGSTTTGAPDSESVAVGFAHDMIASHELVLRMAAWERDHSDDPALRVLASTVDSTYLVQVGRMQGWLDAWNALPVPVDGHLEWMTSLTANTHSHGSAAASDVAAQMSSMTTDAELHELETSSGRELDVLFLQLTLRHHETGEAMLEYAAQLAEVPQVRSLASQILSSQAAEADQLRALLVERGGGPRTG